MFPLKDNIPTEHFPVVTVALIAINVFVFLFLQHPTGFSSVGLMYSPMTCTVMPGTDPVCPSVFSDRELAEMHLTSP